MTTASRSVAVVATRLPITDRRALSQAWYSALHVTQAQTAISPNRAARIEPARAAKTQSVRETPSNVAAPAPARRGAVRAERIGALPFPERRGPATELSRRIERALVHRVTHALAQPVTLAINTGDGRVQLLVRNDGATIRVIALCAPHLRERVDRALAHARFALAANGTRIEAA